MHYVMQFGWAGDGGLGERLIQQVIAGKKTATCCPLAGYSQEEIDSIRASVGRNVDVTDQQGTVRASVRMKQVYEATFGDPPASLLTGEGFPEDPAGFQEAHHRVWADFMAELGESLYDGTLLLVEEFELA